MPVSQAEAVVASQADVVLHNLATKQNMDSFRSETAANFASTNKNIETLRAEMTDCHRDIAITRKEVESLRSELKTDIENLRAETKKISASSKRTLRSSAQKPNKMSL